MKRLIFLALLCCGCSGSRTENVATQAAQPTQEKRQDQPPAIETVKFTDALDNVGKWKNKEFQMLVYFNGNLPLIHFAGNDGKFAGSLMFTGDGTNTEMPLCVERLTTKDTPQAGVGDKLRVTIKAEANGMYYITKMSRP